MEELQNRIDQIEKTYKMIQEIKQFPNSHNPIKPDTKTHQIDVTAIIRNQEGKYLICKRSHKEKAFPNKWCVPGGKIKTTDFSHLPKDTEDHWANVIENTLRKEVREETALEIKNIDYVSNLAFTHPNGHSTIIISMHADLDSGEIGLNQDELTDHAWVTLHEAREFDLIENIYEQIKQVDKKFNKTQSNQFFNPNNQNDQAQNSFSNNSPPYTSDTTSFMP
jgi:8-oxo-dGTP pyrophosphatase MutT (NUDIX family)